MDRFLRSTNAFLLPLLSSIMVAESTISSSSASYTPIPDNVDSQSSLFRAVRSSGKPWLLEFGSERCPDCKQFKRGAWTQAIARLDDAGSGAFEAHTVNIDKVAGMGLANMLGVMDHGVPNVHIVYPGKDDCEVKTICDGEDTSMGACEAAALVSKVGQALDIMRGTVKLNDATPSLTSLTDAAAPSPASSETFSASTRIGLAGTDTELESMETLRVTEFTTTEAPARRPFLSLSRNFVTTAGAAAAAAAVTIAVAASRFKLQRPTDMNSVPRVDAFDLEQPSSRRSDFVLIKEET